MKWKREMIDLVPKVLKSLNQGWQQKDFAKALDPNARVYGHMGEDAFWEQVEFTFVGVKYVLNLNRSNNQEWYMRRVKRFKRRVTEEMRRSHRRCSSCNHIQLWCRQTEEERGGTLEDATQRRIKAFHEYNFIKAHPHGVAVVWSGRDCDGVQYSGSVSILKIDPNGDAPYSINNALEPFTDLYQMFKYHVEETYKWADGPCGYYLTTTEEARKIQYERQDSIREL